MQFFETKVKKFVVLFFFGLGLVLGLPATILADHCTKPTVELQKISSAQQVSYFASVPDASKGLTLILVIDGETQTPIFGIGSISGTIQICKTGIVFAVASWQCDVGHSEASDPKEVEFFESDFKSQKPTISIEEQTLEGVATLKIAYNVKAPNCNWNLKLKQESTGAVEILRSSAMTSPSSGEFVTPPLGVHCRSNDEPEKYTVWLTSIENISSGNQSVVAKLPFAKFQGELNAFRSSETGDYALLIPYKFGNVQENATIYATFLGAYRNSGSENPTKSAVVTQREGISSIEISRGSGTYQIIVRILLCGKIRDTRVVNIRPGCDPAKECKEGTPCFGAPVNSFNGNMSTFDRDPIPGANSFPWARTYSSSWDEHNGYFGKGWHSTFDSWLWPHKDLSSSLETDTFVSFMTETRESFGFWKDPEINRFIQIAPRTSSQSSEFWKDEEGDPVEDVYKFRKGGTDWIRVFKKVNTGDPFKIVRYENVKTGRTITLNFELQSSQSIFPVGVTDSWDNFEWDISRDLNGRIRYIRVIVDGQSDIFWRPGYTKINNRQYMTQIGLQGETPWRTYTYVNARMTQKDDALGNLIEKHAYSGSSATTSIAPDGEFSIEYTENDGVNNEYTRKVTIPGGYERTYRVKYIDGNPVVVEKTGICPSCSADDNVLVLDDLGRIIRKQDARGYISTYEYDSENRTRSMTIGLKRSTCDPTPNETCLISSEELAEEILEATPESLTTTYVFPDYVPDLVPGNPKEIQWLERPTFVSTQSVLDSEVQTTVQFTYDQDTGIVVSRTNTGLTNYHDGNGFVPEVRTSITVPFGAGENIICDDFDVCDADGGSIDWSAAQPKGFVKKTDGARTDVNDWTHFIYYPIDDSVPGPWRGKLAAVKNAADHISRFENYDGFGNAGRLIDPNGVVTIIQFNEFNQMTTQAIEPLGSCDTVFDPLCNTEIKKTYVYHPGGGPLEYEIQPDGDITRYGYDERGRANIVERGESDGDVASAEFFERIFTLYDNGTGKVKSICNLTTSIPGNSSNGQATSPGELSGKEVPLAPPSGTVGSDHFHANNIGWTETKTVSYEYDEFGRLRKTVYPMTETIQTEKPFDLYTYDQNNNVLTVKDAKHQDPNTLFSYDSRNRKSTVSQLVETGVWTTTSFNYDIQSNIISVIDANQNITNYTVDDFGQTIQVDSPVTGISKSKYDFASNVVETSDARSAVIERTFDNLNRIITEDIPNSATSIISGPSGVNYPLDHIYNQTRVEWTYDEESHGFGKGRLTSVIDQVSSHTFDYERRGLTTNKHTIYSSQGDWQVANGDFEMVQLYDLNGNPTVRIYPSSLKVTTSYDFADRPKSVGFNRWIQGPRFGEYGVFESVINNALYAPFGPIIRKEYSNGWLENRSYDMRYFLDELSVRENDSDFGIITHLRYVQDNVGNITDISDLTNPDTSLTFGNGKSGRHFEYDDIYRLRNASAFDSSGQEALYGSFGYGLDLVGNRLDKTQSPTGSSLDVIDEYSYQMGSGSSSNNSILETVTQNFINIRDNLFDNYGNPIDDGKTYYWYDNRNRLLGEQGYSGTTNTGSLRHLYDYTGRRAGHFGSSLPSNCGPGGCAPTNISYAFAAFWGDENICTEVWPGEPENGVVDRIYFAGTPVALIWEGYYGNLTRVTLNDHLGTTYAAGDETGSLLWRAEYDPFGAVAQLTIDEPLEDPGFRFPGQELDHWFRGGPNGPTELYYNVYRYYDPEIGRYTQPDPIGLSTTNNIYSYGNGNPVQNIDPDGLFSQPATYDPTLGGGGGNMISPQALSEAIIVWLAGAQALQLQNPPPYPNSQYDTDQLIQKLNNLIKCASKADPVPPGPNRQDRCYVLYEADTALCTATWQGKSSRGLAICYATAADRLGQCNTGNPNRTQLYL